MLPVLWFATTTSAQVCTPSYAQFYAKCCDIGLRKIYFGNQILFDSTSYSTSAIYTDAYDSVSRNVNAGVSYTIGIRTETFDQVLCMWADYNNNDTFELSELVYHNPQAVPGLTWFSFTPQACKDSLRVRLYADYFAMYGGNPASIDPCEAYYGDYYDFKLYPGNAAGTDVTISKYLSSPSLNIGYNKPMLRIRNFSANIIDSVRVSYSVNGSSPITEKLVSASIGNCGDYDYTFNDSFQAIDGPYIIKSWVKYPNGINPDANIKNDTLIQLACTPLNGTYTINRNQATGGTNFKSFSDAAVVLNTCGVTGPVVFNVAAGNYTDSMTLNTIPGADANNTVTFYGSDTTNRIIRAFNQDAFVLNGTSYITFRKLAIRVPNFNFGGISMIGECHEVTIDSCSIRSINAASYGISVDARISGQSAFPGYQIRITHNLISGFAFGAYLSGAFNQSAYQFQIKHNKIKNNDYGVLGMYIDTLDASDNNISESGYYGTYLYDVNEMNVGRNMIICECYYPIYLGNTNNGRVENNMISGGSTNTNNVINLDASQNLGIYHNSFLHEGALGAAATITTCSNLDVRNNIFYSANAGAFAFEAANSNQFTYLDFNQYYNAGANGNFVTIGSTFSNLNALKGAFGYNNFSTAAKPNFVNLNFNSRNLHLSATLAPGYGDAGVGVTSDYDGDNRCAIAPTIGADESNYNQGTPVSSFSSPDTAFINSPVNFVNNGNFAQGKAFAWYADTATVPTATTANLKYNFTANGTYNVKLQTTNCNGSDDSTRNIVIVTPTIAPVADFKASVLSLDPLESTKFTDLTKGGPSSWHWQINGGTFQGVGIDYDYINGTDSLSQDPEIVFYNPGIYDVCMSADNVAGSSQKCRNSYIKVYNVASICNNQNVSSMFGHFYDEGGKYNNYPYAINKTCDLLIAPCSGPVTLTFDKINFDTSSANLKIYDGTNALGKLLNINSIKAGNTFVAQSGFMYITWNLQYGSYPGWEATWNTQYKFIPKSPATIKGSDTAFENSTASFSVFYYQNNTTYDWDLDGDGTIDNSGRNVDFIYTSTGIYTAICYATSCGGIDTAYKTVRVITPSQAPNPLRFALDATAGSACQLKPQPFYVVEAGVTAQLFDKSGNGPNSWEWNIVNTTKSYSWDNGNTLQNPLITFIDTGYYTIELKATNANGTTTQVFTNVVKVVDAHCTPAVNNAQSDYGITEFGFLNLYNKSTFNGYYSDYTQLGLACVESGTKYGFSMKRGDKTANCKFGIWIDYNQDGDFSDAGELVKTIASYTQLSWSDSIKIPALSNNVLYGHAVMRIGVIPSNAVFYNCGTNNIGEFEDYSLFISDDQTPPLIKLLGADSVKTPIGQVYNDAGATAFDNLDGNIPVMVSNPVNTQSPGYYTVRFDATDKAGNSAMPVYRVVNVSGDNQPPVITLIGSNPLYHNVNTSFNDPGVTAYDSADGVINNITVRSNVNVNVLGNYTITYIAADSRGNADSISRSVVVVDSLAPVISLTGKDTLFLEVNTGYKEPGFSASDNYDPNPVITVSPQNPDTTHVNTIILTYTATDSKGNKSQRKRWLIFRDHTAPVVTLKGLDTVYIEVKGTYTEVGADVKDNYDKNIFLQISGGPVNTATLGTTLLYYAATDSSGNSTIEKRVVIVRKTSKPLIQLVGNDTIYLFTGQSWTEQGVTFNDAYYSGSTLQGLLKTGGTFPNPANVSGTYHYWYQVTDPSGNASDTAFRYFVISANGIYIPEQAMVSLYPNPASDVVYLKGRVETGDLIYITDINGKRINMPEKYDGNGVSVKGLAPGIYILHLEGADGSRNIRFEVTR